MRKKIIFGIVGSVILFIAQFSSTVRVPVLGGTEGYIYNGIESILFILGLSIVSFVFTVRKKFKLLRITSIIAIVTPVLFYVYATTVLSEIRSNIEYTIITETEIPAEFALTLVKQPVEILFGEILLALGAILLCIAAFARFNRKISASC